MLFWAYLIWFPRGRLCVCRSRPCVRGCEAVLLLWWLVRLAGRYPIFFQFHSVCRAGHLPVAGDLASAGVKQYCCHGGSLGWLSDILLFSSIPTFVQGTCLSLETLRLRVWSGIFVIVAPSVSRVIYTFIFSVQFRLLCRTLVTSFWNHVRVATCLTIRKCDLVV